MKDSLGAAAVLQDVEGTVKWFDPRKGFGFIIGPDEQDIFVHFSQIEGDGFRALKDGCRVIYSAERGEKGWHATKVQRIDEPEVRVRPVGVSTRNPRRSV